MNRGLIHMIAGMNMSVLEFLGESYFCTCEEVLFESKAE